MGRSVCNVAEAKDEGMRIDAFLASCEIFPSRSAAAKAVEAGKVLVNGKEVKKKYSVRNGDAVVSQIEDDLDENELIPQDIPLDVRYEDESLAVISKQAGLLTHPSENHESGTLANALLWKYGKDGLCNVQGEGDRPGIVHRLDGDTSGLMLVAKTDEAGEALMDAIRLRAVDRRYICLVHGIVAPDTAMIDAPIARHPTDRTRMAVADTTSSRDAITTFRVLERFEGDGTTSHGYTLLECKLFTGRTHQIRVHMQYAKHPVVGDPIYVANGPKDEASNMKLGRQFLHSWSLGLDHPITGKRLEIEDVLPEDLLCVYREIESSSRGRTEVGEEILKKIAP